MRLLSAVVLIAIGAAGAIAVDRLVLEPSPTASDAPPVTGSEPAPGSPPLVWLEGTMEEVSEGSLSVREGQGELVELERAAAGATRVFRLDDERWAELPDQEAAEVEGGPRVCVEALLDGGTKVVDVELSGPDPK
ncbi:MAG: hypothetical protein ACRDHB_05635, partial [Actinomycetota bacterium]